MSMPLDVLIGRQPIYNNILGIYAYELLFRGMGRTQADVATAQVVVNAFQEFGIDKLAGTSRIGINLSRSLLSVAHELPIPPERVIFDIPPGLAGADEMPQLRLLSKMGFTLALDDVRYDPAMSDAYSLADIVKIDIRGADAKTLPDDIAAFRRHGLKILALRIESLTEFEYLRDLGFDYFQGYFLSHPRVVKSSSLPPNKVAVLQLFAIVYDPVTETRDIEKAIAADPILSYKLLRLINSAFYNLPRPVTSLRDTIILLGRRRLATWCILLSLTHLSDKPAAIFIIALARARMCELLEEGTAKMSTGDGFIVGLLSALDLLLDRPLRQVIAPLPLSANVKEAILGHEGALGHYLQAVLSYEISQWRQVAGNGIPPGLLMSSRMDALNWAESILSSTSAAAGAGRQSLPSVKPV